MPSIDLIALDLDGTLLSPDDTVSDANRAAIARALGEGTRVVFVTGRGVDTPIRLARELDVNLPIICAHGALTKDFAANRTLAHIPVPLPYAKVLVDFAEARDLPIALYSDEAFWRRPGTEVFISDMVAPMWREVDSLHEKLGSAPTFIRFLGPKSVAAINEHFSDLPLNFRHEHWNDFVECAVLAREASKKNALSRLCADFQIPQERVLAVGDSRNDVPMLQWAGVGVAMGNAQADVRAAVRYVTADNAHDGVALAIERFCFTAAAKSA